MFFATSHYRFDVADLTGDRAHLVTGIQPLESMIKLNLLISVRIFLAVPLKRSSQDGSKDIDDVINISGFIKQFIREQVGIGMAFRRSAEWLPSLNDSTRILSRGKVTPPLPFPELGKHL